MVKKKEVGIPATAFYFSNSPQIYYRYCHKWDDGLYIEYDGITNQNNFF